MTAAWDGRASAEGWWWVTDRYGEQFPAQWRMELWWSSYWEMPRDPVQLLRNDYQLGPRCEPPGEAELRPVAWMRGGRTGGNPSDPPEYYEEAVAGEDRPDGEGWTPLYARPESVRGAALRGWKACRTDVVRIIRERGEHWSKQVPADYDEHGENTGRYPAECYGSAWTCNELAREIEDLTPPKDAP